MIRVCSVRFPDLPIPQKFFFLSEQRCEKKSETHTKKRINQNFFFFFFSSQSCDNLYIYIYNIQEGSADYFVFDCYLLSNCDSEDVVPGSYIYVHYTSGVDGESCGEQTSPCKNLAYALDKAQSGDEVQLLDGATQIPSFTYSLPAKRFTVRGIPTADGEPVYPEIFMSYASTYVLQFAQKCQGTLDSFRVLVNASAMQQMRFFMHVTSNGNVAYLKIKFGSTDYFYDYFFFFFVSLMNMTTIGSGIETTLFYLEGNSPVYFVGCYFYNFASKGTNSCGLFFARQGHNVNVTIDSCLFDNLTDSNVHMVIFGQNGDYTSNCSVTFSNNILKNLQANNTHSSQPGMLYAKSHRWVGSNNTYFNILTTTNTNGYCGGVYGVSNDGFSNLTLINDSFRNISNAGNGGAVHTACTRNFTLTACSFELCSSTSKSGGAVYISNTGIFTYVSCRFYDNTAATGGKDVGHGQNILSSYSSSNFLHSCSNSTNNRIAFPDNSNLNHLLLGMFDMIVCIFIYYFVTLFRMCNNYILCCFQWL
jgi:hypothetical protein